MHGNGHRGLLVALRALESALVRLNLGRELKWRLAGLGDDESDSRGERGDEHGRRYRGPF